MALEINHKTILSKLELIKYQLINYCFINKIWLNETQLNCLAILGEMGKVRLTLFGEEVVRRKVYGNPVAANNCLDKIDKRLWVKEGAGKKIIYLNPNLQIVSEGNVVINIKLIKSEAKESTGSVQKNSRQAELA